MSIMLRVYIMCNETQTTTYSEDPKGCNVVVSIDDIVTLNYDIDMLLTVTLSIFAGNDEVQTEYEPQA